MRRMVRGMNRCSAAGLTALVLVALLPSVGWAGASSPEKCVLAKLAAARGFTVCVLKAQEKNFKKAGSANEAECLGKLKSQWDAIEAKAGPGVCPVYRGDMSAASFVLTLKQELDLGIRPPTELVVFDAGPATGQQLGEDTPHGRCSGGNTEELVCRRMPAIVSDESYGPAALLPQAFSFPQDVPLRSIGGVQIADDWDAFLSGTWDACLQTTAGAECTTPAGVLPDGARWWSGYDPEGGADSERSCTDWSLALILMGGETAFVGSSSTDGVAGHPSPWGPIEVACDEFAEADPDVPHVLCLCF